MDLLRAIGENLDLRCSRLGFAGGSYLLADGEAGDAVCTRLEK